MKMNHSVTSTAETNLSAKACDVLRISGIYAPTLTAFSADGSVNLEGIRVLVRFLLEEGVHGLTPLGSAGEPFGLTVPERKAVLETIVDEVAGRVPVYAGVMAYSTELTVELGVHAKELGCDGLMLTSPIFLRPPRRDVLDHFRRIRERVGLPIMLYNVPILTGHEVTPEELSQLAREDVVHAVKWSHPELDRIHRTRIACGPAFPVFAGVDLIAFGALAAGADGWIGGLPVMVPELAVKLDSLLRQNKDVKAAQELWSRLQMLVQIEYRAINTTDNDP